MSGRHWQCPNDVSRDRLGLALDGEELGFLLRLALGPGEHPGMVLLGQHLSQLDQSANRQPAVCQSIRDDRKPREETGHFRSPECRGLRKPQLANTVIEERSVSELAIEPPLGKASQLDDELDYQVPLPPNQVGKAAVEITRGGRFHENQLARVSPPSCEGKGRPWANDPVMAAFRPPVARPLTAECDARVVTALLSRPRSRRQKYRPKPSSEKSAKRARERRIPEPIAWTSEIRWGPVVVSWPPGCPIRVWSGSGTTSVVASPRHSASGSCRRTTRHPTCS